MQRGWIVVILGLAACTAPALAPARPEGVSAGSPSSRQSPITLVVAEGFEPAVIGRLGRNDTEPNHMAYAGLVTRDTEAYKVLPWMAEELPSIDKGTWRVNADGTMQTNYRLKPNIKWHDGTPFKASDFGFGWQLMSDPKMEFESRGVVELIDRVETPDDRTVILHWKKRYAQADAVFSTLLFPLPSHLLGEGYAAREYEAMNNHPYWSTAVVHLGPFKVAEFARGSHIDFVAFDEYFLGRPKIDRVIWRIITDGNAMLASVLANEVEVTMRSALTLDTALVAEQQWAARGEGTVRFAPTSWSWLNPSGTSPIFGWDAPGQNAVRQGLLHAIDRQEMVDTISHGKEEVAHFPLASSHPAFRAVDPSVMKYAHESRRADQLFAEAGWRRGADGVLVNDRGDRFSSELRASSRVEFEQPLGAIAGYFKGVGVETQILQMPERQLSSPDVRNRWPGFFLGSHNMQVEDWDDRFLSGNIPTAANNWVPINVSRWSNPAKDGLIASLEDTLEARQRERLIVDWLKLFTEELPHLPLRYNAEITSYRSTVKNVPVRIESGGENYRTWNVHLWEKTG